MSMPASMTGSLGASVTLSADTGGTFTDLVVDAMGEFAIFKAMSTPDDPTRGVLDAVELAAEAYAVEVGDLLGRADVFIHGTTRAINSLLAGGTARTAFLTTEGHPDILLFREGGRANPFDFSQPYPEPFVPRSLTFEVPGRVAADGTIVRELDEEALLAIIRRLVELGVEAVGVALLWSIVNPEHECRVGELLERHLPGIPFTLSHQLNPTLREYRRASSACIDASLKPLMADYLQTLERRLSCAGFSGELLIVTSQGGVITAEEAQRAPIHTINSGPSMAPVAGRKYSAAECEAGAVIVADSGGTTFDVSLVRDGVIPRTRETWIGAPHHGHITGFPSVDVKSIGAGGGSIAWLDDGGLLHVGPRSAGANPGPACYGRGGHEPTFTDACLVLGYLDRDFFLGGAMSLDEAAARDAVSRHIADPLGLAVEEAAAAIVELGTEEMVRAIEEITVHQGLDPRSTVLVGAGGAAGLNIVRIASRLGCPRILIPETGAALSASGALLSELTAEFAVTCFTSSLDFDDASVGRALATLQERCDAFFARFPAEAGRAIDFSYEGRYPRQNWEIEVQLPSTAGVETPEPDALVASFHDAHRRVFALADEQAPVEFVAWRARARVQPRAHGRRLARSTRSGPTAGQRQIWLADEGWTSATVVDFDALPEGDQVLGPAVAESSFTTVVLGRATVARKSASGNLVIDLEVAA